MSREKRCTGGAGAGRTQKKAGKGRGGQIFLAVVTLLNLLLPLAISVMNRQQVIKAVRDDEGVQVLLQTQKETKN